MNILHLRIVLDHQEDIFRDIEISGEDNLEDLHKAIVSAFGLSQDEMAAFYLSNEEWEQGEEIPLISMKDGEMEMRDISLHSILREEDSKLLYIQDFLLMWRFMISVEDFPEKSSKEELPCTLLSFGEMPEKAPSIQFVSEKESNDDPYGDIMDEFDDFEEYNEFGEY
jgi:hypothetical protein